MFQGLSFWASALVFILNCTLSHACDLKVAWTQDIPYHWKNEKGEVVGSEVRLLNSLLDKMDCKATYIEMPWARGLHYIENGKIDMVIGAKFTLERAEFAHYSNPYRVMKHHILVSKTTTEDWPNLESFFDSKKTLGAVIGWGYPPGIAKVIENPKYINQVQRAPAFNSLPNMLLYEHVDAIIAHLPSLKAITTEEQLRKVHSIFQYEEPLHFLFSKKTTYLPFVHHFNDNLLDLKRAHALSALFPETE